jgi:hypothetical protein
VFEAVVKTSLPVSVQYNQYLASLGTSTNDQQTKEEENQREEQRKRKVKKLLY